MSEREIAEAFDKLHSHVIWTEEHVRASALGYYRAGYARAAAEVARLTDERDAARVEVDRLRDAIGGALKAAGNRWSEWGTRAETVEEILVVGFSPAPAAGAEGVCCLVCGRLNGDAPDCECVYPAPTPGVSP